MTVSTVPPLSMSTDTQKLWLNTPAHVNWMKTNAAQQLTFFRSAQNPKGGFFQLDYDGWPLDTSVQELFLTTRYVHSYALGKLAGQADCDNIIDHGMSFLWSAHRDTTHGGYVWAVDNAGIHDDRKLAYGHIFVLLAGASAKMVGHPDAERLLNDVLTVLDEKFWEADRGLFADEFNRDWTPFSTYRGMNANMHAIEAFLTVFEATNDIAHLNRAGQILDFFTDTIAPNYEWRLPEHYTADWQVDPTYGGHPMFRPAGSTPGHSFEIARLLLQHWDLSGRPDNGAVDKARKLMDAALTGAWDSENGGFFYTLAMDGTPDVRVRLWWPVTEAIGVLASFLKLSPTETDEAWYRKLWQFAEKHYIDPKDGAWIPELDDKGQIANEYFPGKPDIYHSLQATLFPATPGLSRMAQSLGD